MIDHNNAPRGPPRATQGRAARNSNATRLGGPLGSPLSSLGLRSRLSRDTFFIELQNGRFLGTPGMFFIPRFLSARVKRFARRIYTSPLWQPSRESRRRRNALRSSLSHHDSSRTRSASRAAWPTRGYPFPLRRRADASSPDSDGDSAISDVTVKDGRATSRSDDSEINNVDCYNSVCACVHCVLRTSGSITAMKNESLSFPRGRQRYIIAISLKFTTRQLGITSDAHRVCFLSRSSAALISLVRTPRTRVSAAGVARDMYKISCGIILMRHETETRARRKIAALPPPNIDIRQ